MKGFIFLSSLIIGFLPVLINSQGADLGDCACLCGLDRSQDTSQQNFVSRVRGAKGERGLRGKTGSRGVQGLTGIRGPPGPPGASRGPGSSDALPSCYDYRSAGSSTNGVFKIKPAKHTASYETYCDMETAGGGWTLVATIHENNIKGKCSLGDLWSDDQGRFGPSVSSNWENTNVFGNIESATSEDYKNSAYFTLPSSDVMIWHVPNEASLNDWSRKAFFKYHTSDGFLNDYGGSLYSLFNKYYPLTNEKRGSSLEGVTVMLQGLTDLSSDITSLIDNFFNYGFDSSSNNEISDGGNDMYDTGNKVYFRSGSSPYQQLVYGERVTNLEMQFEYSSTPPNIYPFTALAIIGNQNGLAETFDMKVESGTGADGSGSSSSYDGTLTKGNFQMKYKTYNIFSTDDPSIHEVYFFVSNTDSNSWGSSSNPTFSLPQWSSSTDNLVNTIRILNYPQNVVAGYTLLSTTDSTLIPQEKIEAVLRIYLNKFSEFRGLPNFNCSRVDQSVVTPVTFTVGTQEDMENSIPIKYRRDTTPGFIQFRALNPNGVPYAVCPGVKTSACRPSSICVGGVSTYSTEPNQCGDFTGWDGDNELENQNSTSINPTARSARDIQSTIMIFTRDTSPPE